jgi:peptidoglycan hydrolase-like protein with peptidoglycan-binding domain
MNEYSVYTSFDDVPLDEPSTSEGDDSLHAHDLGAGGALFLAPLRPTLAAPEAKPKLIVPHPRDLERGMAGKDVLALQRALSRAKFHSWNLRTGQFGAQLQKDVKRFQATHGLVSDGVYGKLTHSKLAKFYTAYEIDLILQTMETPMHKAQRLWLAAAMQLYNMRARVHYTQGSARMWIVKHHLTTLADLAHQSTIYEDCSSSVTGLSYVAGVPDPNGFKYNGLGYTGTLGVMGRRWYGNHPPIGTLGFYGRYYPWVHVVGVVSSETSKQIRVFSHGSEDGPLVLAADYRGLPSQWRVYPGLNY